jgi:hypothetical protein
MIGEMKKTNNVIKKITTDFRQCSRRMWFDFHINDDFTGTFVIGKNEYTIRKETLSKLREAFVPTSDMTDGIDDEYEELFQYEVLKLLIRYSIIGIFSGASNNFLRPLTDDIVADTDGELFASPFDFRCNRYLSPFPEDSVFGSFGVYPYDRMKMAMACDRLYANPPFIEYIQDDVARFLVESGRPFVFIMAKWDDSESFLEMVEAGIDPGIISDYESSVDGITITIPNGTFVFIRNG